MTNPTRDEIAMALLRATDRFEAGKEDLPTNEHDMKMLLAGILADAVLALMASKREAAAATPDGTNTPTTLPERSPAYWAQRAIDILTNRHRAHIAPPRLDAARRDLANLIDEAIAHERALQVRAARFKGCS